jgi:hypothetical protein
VIEHLNEARLKHDWPDALQIMLRNSLMGGACEHVVRAEQALASADAASSRDERAKFARLALDSSLALLRLDKKNNEALLLHG